MRIGEDCNFEVTTYAQMLYLRLYCIWHEIQPVEESSLSYDSESVPIWEQTEKEFTRCQLTQGYTLYWYAWTFQHISLQTRK